MKETWQKFLHWKGWAACAAGWQTFLHWKGWGNFVRWKGWSAFVHWNGWKAFAQWKVWHPHPLVILLLSVVSCGALVWIFAGGREQTFFAYPVYCIAAYAVTVLSIGIPGIIRWIKNTVLNHALIKPLVESEEKRFLLDLFREQVINFGYGIFKTVSGIFLSVPWIWADGLYNLVQGIIQLAQLALHRKHLPIEKQWKSYRICGWMILLVHLTMTGLVFMMIHQGQAEEYPGYMIFATAAFAFYKLISAFIDVAKDRKHASPVDSSVYLLDLTQALFSLFSLQVAMIHAFDDGTLNAVQMNSATGGVVCLLVMGTGVYMIRRANRELKNIQEEK